MVNDSYDYSELVKDIDADPAKLIENDAYEEDWSKVQFPTSITEIPDGLEFTWE